MNAKKHAAEPPFGIKVSVLDAVRQWRFPSEFRIPPPCLTTVVSAMAEMEPENPPELEAVEEPVIAAHAPISKRFLAEIATCFWYLKTKHFNRAWEDDGTDENKNDDGPQTLRAIRRLTRGIDALVNCGIEVVDPTNKRYPQGGEGMMRPIEFLPTAGLTIEMVTETIVPIVYHKDELIQRGEVFVAVPREAAGGAAPSATAAATADTDGHLEICHAADALVEDFPSDERGTVDNTPGMASEPTNAPGKEP